jgi:hypothetical protein
MEAHGSVELSLAVSMFCSWLQQRVLSERQGGLMSMFQLAETPLAPVPEVRLQRCVP